MTNQTYTFEPYDVLQILSRDSKWLDFSTLRTAIDGERARDLVLRGRWEGEDRSFRITRYAVCKGYIPVFGDF